MVEKVRLPAEAKFRIDSLGEAQAVRFVDDGFEPQADDVVFGLLAFLDLIAEFLDPSFDVGDLLLAPLHVALEGFVEELRDLLRHGGFFGVILCRLELADRLVQGFEVLALCLARAVRVWPSPPADPAVADTNSETAHAAERLRCFRWGGRI